MASTQETHRFLVALPRGEKDVFLAWRLLTEDAPMTAFHIERRRSKSDAWERVTAQPISDSTNFIDSTPQATTYEYRVIAADESPSEIVEVDALAKPSLLARDIPLNPDDTVGGIAIGELLGDSRMGYFRENIVTVDAERNRLMVLVNPTIAHRRGYSPFDDFAYRHDRSQHGSGYYIYLSPPDTRRAPVKESRSL